ncbi:EpsG family protein [Vibrio parahaemolyticus]
MYIYIIVFFFLALCSMLQVCLNERHKYLVVLLYLYFSAYLIAFAGLRGVGVGADDANYLHMFHKIPNIIDWIYGDFVYTFNAVWMEPGYIVYGAIFKTISEHAIAIFLPVAFLSLSIASYSYYKLSPIFFISLLLLFSHNYLYRDINQIRSAIVCALGLVLIINLHKDRFFLSFFTVITAITFHMSAIVYFVAFVLNKIKYNKKFILKAVLFSIFISVTGVVSSLISNLTFLGPISVKLAGYTSTEKYVNSVGLFDVTNVKNMFVFFLLYTQWDLLYRRYKTFPLLFVFFAFGTAWRIGFSELGIISARIATLFTISEVIILPMFASVFKSKFLPTVMIIIYAFIMLYINLFVKEGRHPYFMSLGVL